MYAQTASKCSDGSESKESTKTRTISQLSKDIETIERSINQIKIQHSSIKRKVDEFKNYDYNFDGIINRARKFRDSKACFSPEPRVFEIGPGEITDLNRSFFNELQEMKEVGKLRVEHDISLGSSGVSSGDLSRVYSIDDSMGDYSGTSLSNDSLF